MIGSRIAVYGGTFDPIHQAHIAVAVAARQRFGFDKILVAPSANPPHKPRSLGATFDQRFRMVELACAGLPGLVPSRIEETNESGFTYDAITRLRAEYPDIADWYFLIGADAFGEIETWYRWRQLLQMVTFVIVTRPGHSIEVPEGAEVLTLESLEMDVSSTRIRAQLAEGEQPEDLPEDVYRFICREGIYGWKAPEPRRDVG